jgi:hypothetical protein
VKLQFEGIHCWPGCPFEEVKFLRSPHRHVFHVTATKVVTHDDRQVEIIMLKRAMEDWAKADIDFESQSCEMIAKDMVEQFGLSSCEVLEDGENGAVVEA